MPLYASAFFIATSASIPYILEDTFQKGGYRSVATIADRDAIKSAARKQGMIVFVREEKALYWLPDSVTAGADAWKPLDVTAYVNFDWQDPLSMDKDFKVSIDKKRLVPLALDTEAGRVLLATPNGEAVWTHFDPLPSRNAAQAGWALLLDPQKGIIWGKVDGLPDSDGVPVGHAILLGPEGAVWGAVDALPPTKDVPKGSAIILGDNGAEWGTVSGLPSTENVAAGSTIILGPEGAMWQAVKEKKRVGVGMLFGIMTQGQEIRRTVDISCITMMILRLGVQHPYIRIDIYDNPDFKDDTNPYSFSSMPGQLEDNGISIREDGEKLRNRRYALFSNPLGVTKMYVKVTSNYAGPIDVNLSMTVLPME